jgi:NAD(P)-dependent dehydrogenase (short-subunit alcohol dehydrogenase family)
VTAIRFDERVVLVTGAGRGLGAAYARAFGARGAAVVVHDAGVDADGTGADPTLADAVVAEIEAAGGMASACHENLEREAGCRQTVEHALERFGRLDVVVQNAGLLVWEELESADRSWERMRSVNVDAPFHVARAALPAMKAQSYGRFVYTTSGRAMWPEASLPGLAAYSVGKLAHVALMLVTAAEGGPHGVLANAVSPVAATRMLRRPAEEGEFHPAQVAPGVLFLASERCTSSGVVLRVVDGHFSTAQWEHGEGIDLGREPVEPEVIEENWPAIEGVLQHT